MATIVPTHSSDRLPLLAPPAEETFTNPPEYYASAPTTTTNPGSVRFQSPAHDNTDAQSFLPPYSPPAGLYRGFSSQDEYLAALRAWAEDKALMAPPDKSALPGFYGRETMEECIAKNPRLRSGGKNGRKGLNGGGGEDMQVEGERDGQREGEEEERGFVGQQRPDGRRKSSISRWLSRKQTK